MASFIDEFLGPASNQLGSPADDGKPKSFIDEFLPRVSSEATTPRITVTPRPPMYVADPSSPTGERIRSVEEESKVKTYEEPSFASRAMALPIDAAKHYGEVTAKHWSDALEMSRQGAGAIRENRPAEGVGKIGLGLISAPLAPLTAAIDVGVKEPVTALTGSKQTGDKAGLLVGSGLPVAKASKMAIEAMPTNKAITAIVDTIGPDRLPSVINELKRNPRLSIMDVVPETKQMSQKLITTEGQHVNKFTDWVNERIGSAKGAVSDIYDTTMGTPVNVVKKLDDMKASARKIGKNEIEPALAGSKPVDMTGVVANIDAKLKPGVNSVISAGDPLPLGDLEKPLAALRKFITDDKSFRTDPKQLHQFQSALRAKADDLLNSQSPQDRQLGHGLMRVRNDIVKAIDDASGGKYAPALGKYKDEMEIQNAFNMGQLITRNKLGRVEDSPEFWEQWAKTASKEELEAAREGARLAVNQQVKGFKAGARKGTDIVESEFNREKLSALFGKKEVDEMAQFLKDEREIALTNSHLINNSQTAMRMKADKRVDLPVEKGNPLGALVAPVIEGAVAMSTGVPGAGILVGGAQLAGKAKHKLDTKLATRRNDEITNLLTAKEGPERDALIAILESHLPQPKQSMLQRARNLALPIMGP